MKTEAPLLASWRRAASHLSSLPTSTAVLGAGLSLVVLHVAFRAWALAGSWFYLDDYRILFDARTSDFSVDYLLTPYNSHLMPGGRALASLVVESGTMNWGLAWGLVLAFQAAAALASLWACLTLFGRRWATLVPVALYLTTVLTLPAMMWWTAAVNQVPLQLAFFLAVGSWVRHLRTRRVLWLVATVGAMALGLAFYVKALLVFPVLAYLALAYFAEGGPVSRLKMVVSKYWPAAVAGSTVALAYVAYYRSSVTGPFTETTPALVGEIADTLIGTSFMTAVVGGPWQWVVLAPPNSFAAPPEWTVRVAWIVVTLIVLVAFTTRLRTMRAWVLLIGYLLGSLALLVTSRGAEYGGLIGLEYRYLTDASGVAALCVGVAFLELRGASDSSVARDEPLLRATSPRKLVLAMVGLIAMGGIVSSLKYVTTWHADNASKEFTRTLAGELGRAGRVDLADLPVADPVYPAIFAPDNNVSRFTTLLSEDVRFPVASADLGVVAADGTLRSALIGPGVESEPGRERGQRAGCPWKVTDRGRTIPLAGRAFDFVWWLRIGYLYSEDSPIAVIAAGDTVTTQVLPGVNSLYVRVEGTFDEVRIEGLNPGTTLCVDTIEVGPVEPGGPL